MGRTETRASTVGLSEEEISVSESDSEAGYTCLPIPEGSGGAQECPWTKQANAQIGLLCQGIHSV